MKLPPNLYTIHILRNVMYYYKKMSISIHINSLIFFDYPGPKWSEENQFTPLGVGVNKLIFKR
jgi:hypothetical protein